MSLSENKQKYSYLLIHFCLFVCSFIPLKLSMQQKEQEPKKIKQKTSQYLYINIYLLNSVLLHNIVILFAIDILFKNDRLCFSQYLI